MRRVNLRNATEWDGSTHVTLPSESETGRERTKAAEQLDPAMHSSPITHIVQMLPAILFSIAIHHGTSRIRFAGRTGNLRHRAAGLTPARRSL